MFQGGNTYQKEAYWIQQRRFPKELCHQGFSSLGEFLDQIEQEYGLQNRRENVINIIIIASASAFHNV